MMTMNKLKLAILASLTILFSTTMSAQDKLFTLEDLNYGGTNYANLRPQNMWLTWWGEQLIQTDVEACFTIDTKTGKKECLFTLDDINKWSGSDEERYVRHLMNATFPYPDKPIVAVGNRKAYILIDFKAKQIVWQDSISGQQANDWNATSRATAYVEDHQLFVVDGQGRKHQDRPYIVTSSASTREPSGVLTAINWPSTAWTSVWLPTTRRWTYSHGRQPTSQINIPWQA